MRSRSRREPLEGEEIGCAHGAHFESEPLISNPTALLHPTSLLDAFAKFPSHLSSSRPWKFNEKTPDRKLFERIGIPCSHIILTLRGEKLYELHFLF
jgi:hypothetical protein